MLLSNVREVDKDKRQFDEDAVTIKYDIEGSYKEIITAQETHIGTRPYQQDSAYASDTVCFQGEKQGVSYAVLCDGMGGMEHGSEASELVVRQMTAALDAYSPAAADMDIRSFMLEQAYALDDQVYQRFGQGAAGTTLVAVYLADNQLQWISAGDSRIYLLRCGKIIQLTRDHNLLLALMLDVQRGKLSEDEALAHPKKEALISYLGCGELEIVDSNSQPLALEHGDIILLCSDGLTKSLTDQQICCLVLENYGNLKEAARLLPLVAFDTGGVKDNTSVILMQYFE